VFEYSLHKSLPDTNLAKRLRNIADTHTFNVYNYGCTGIFEKHKLLFSFQITLKLKIDEGNVSIYRVLVVVVVVVVVGVVVVAVVVVVVVVVVLYYSVKFL